MAELEQVIRRMAQKGMNLEEIQALVKSLRGTELSSEELELARSILGEAPAPGVELVTTSISPSTRGAIFRLRRRIWFEISRRSLDPELSGRSWREFVPKLIELANREGISRSPSRIELQFTQEIADDRKYLKPLRAKIVVYERAREYFIG